MSGDLLPSIDPGFPLSPAFRSRYQLVEPISGGKMSLVFRALQRALNRTVVVKFLLDPEDADLSARFQREAQLLQEMRGPGLMPLLDFGTEGDRFYLMLPFVAGTNLQQLIEERHRLEWTEVHRIAFKLAAALDVIHQAGILHRDIKPANVVLSGTDASLFLIDFGISLARGKDRLTEDRDKTFPGTFVFASPEQILLTEIDARSDLYSLGALLYTCLTGELPHTGTSVPHLLNAKLNRRITTLGLESPDGPCPLEPIVLKLLERERSNRFASAADLARALEAIAPPGASCSWPAPEERKEPTGTATKVTEGSRRNSGEHALERWISPTSTPHAVARIVSRAPWIPGTCLVLVLMFITAIGFHLRVAALLQARRSPEGPSHPQATATHAPDSHENIRGLQEETRATIADLFARSGRLEGIDQRPSRDREAAIPEANRLLTLMGDAVERLDAHRVEGEIWLELFVPAPRGGGGADGQGGDPGGGLKTRRPRPEAPA